MFLKRNRKYSILKPHIIIFSFFLSFLSLFFIPQISVSAAPVPAHLSLSIVNPNVDFHFNQTENVAATFKQETAVVEYNTDNSTGFTAYVSSIDEDTNLNHVDSSVTQKITSITSPRLSTSFDPKTWGYRANQTVFKSVPKASLPDSAFSINHSEIAKFFLHFGVKTGPDLTSGTYSKKILVTAITNRVPTSTTFIPGQNFRDALVGLGALGVIKSFNHSTSAPPAGANTKIVSTADSDIPAYVWYDAASQSILWYSDADIAYANEDSSYMFYDIGNNSSNTNLIDTAGINTSRVKNMRFMFSGGKWIIKKIKITNLDTSNVEDMSYMFAASPYEQSITADPIDLSGFNTSKVTNMQGMFSGSHFPFIDIRHFDTSNVTNMKSMFADLHKVTSLDLSGLNVKKVNNIQNIFFSNSSNSKLQSLSLAGWELDSITSMGGLFNNLSELTSLNLNGFTTKNVTDMSYMFFGTKKLANLDLSSFDTSNVTNMAGMFQSMESLTSLNLSNFNTSNVTDMNNMFRDNFALKTLNLSSFDTSNVTNMAEMFRHSGSIYPLDVSTFDTRKVTNMTNMFYSTLMSPENSTLDISNFDTRSLVSAAGMFNYTKAKTIYTSNKFTVAHLSPSPTAMFMTNDNLVGGNGTAYVWPNYTSAYAHIDAPGNPGYFTQKP